MIEKINKQDAKFSDIPETCNGEILLERVYSNDGAYAGCVTCAEHKVTESKQMTAAQRVRSGWERYVGLDDYDDSGCTLPDCEAYKTALLVLIDKLSSKLEIKNLPSYLTRVSEIQACNDTKQLMRIRHIVDDIAVEDIELGGTVYKELISKIEVLL